MRQRAGLFENIEWRAGLVVAAIGLAVVDVITLLLGYVAKTLQGPVDDPMFARIERAGNTAWTDKLETLTQMGNVQQTQIYAAVFAVVLAVWFAVKGWRWWMPLFVCPTVWWAERASQLVIAKLVGRDRDPISLVGTPIGAYPSGGCARLIVVLGAAAFLVVHYARVSRRTTILLFAAVAVLGLAEGYFRARLNQHWFTDVVGGVIFGWLLLGLVIRTIRTFDPDPRRERVATTDAVAVTP